MRDHILIFVNGISHQVRGADAFLTLSDFLRRRLGLTGTKIVCSEGDCGSCSVLWGRPEKEKFVYRSIDSCIRFVFQLDGQSVITVEGLSSGEKLHPIQTAMIDCHGSQCGFCTPGFVVAMAGMLEFHDTLNDENLRCGLTGNLCRCTGYTPIIEAGKKCSADQSPGINEIYPPAPMLAELNEEETICLLAGDGRTVYCPENIEIATKLLSENPEAKLVAGATDVGVQFNKGFLNPQIWIDLNRVAELEGVAVVERQIVAGSRASWAELEAVAAKHVPQFKKIISVFGSPQIRHAGTIGGNIVNASPIADSLPFLFVCNATLELVSIDGVREVAINEFYSGYKKFDLRPGEILSRITIPLPSPSAYFKLYKVSRRRDLDISTFTAAILLETSGESIASAQIAYGAVGPTVMRLPKTETFLAGKEFRIESMIAAGEIAVSEITPLSDVRGSSDFRFQLARNIFQKFFLESQSELSTV